jgi:periplasmic protein TonB
MKRILFKIAFLLLISLTTKEQLWGQTKEVFVLSPKLSKHAEYPEGQAAMYNFIRKNLKYPKIDTSPIKGTVYLNFCIESDGRITNINLVKGFHPYCDEEAKRVFSIMPKWIPAIEAGTNKPIRSHYTLPCAFKGE